MSTGLDMTLPFGGADKYKHREDAQRPVECLVMRYREGYHNGWPTVMHGDKPVDDFVGELNKLATALEQYEKALLMWHAQQKGRAGRDGNAPGHGHETPGVWDSDNGPIAGHTCAECTLWKMAETLAHNGQDQAGGTGPNI